MVLSSRGRLDPSLLDLPRAPVFRTLFNPLAHSRRRAQQQQRQQHHQQQPLSPQGHAADGENGSGAPAASSAPSAPPVLQPRQPLRFVSQPQSQSTALSESQPQPQATCGWLFSSDDVFDRQLLAALLQGLWPHVARLKGIFRRVRWGDKGPDVDTCSGAHCARLPPRCKRWQEPSSQR